MHGRRALLAVAALGGLERLVVVLCVDAQEPQGLGVRLPVPPAPAARFANAHPREELQRVDHAPIQTNARVSHERQGFITGVRSPTTRAHRWQSVLGRLLDVLAMGDPIACGAPARPESEDPRVLRRFMG